jgi:hypothetical protein
MRALIITRSKPKHGRVNKKMQIKAGKKSG